MTKKPDDDSDIDKTKMKKKKTKKTTKGKKKVKKPVKKRQKIKIINPSIQTTLPPNPRPIAYNIPLVSGLVDKNDAKEIEKIKNIVNKGREIILDIKQELNEENRPRGRPKGSKNKIKIEKEDIIIIPPKSGGVQTRSKTKALTNKSPIKIKEEIKEEKQRGRQKKGSKNKIKIEDNSDPIKIQTTDAPIPQVSFNEETNSFFKPGDNDDDNLFNYITNRPIQRQEINKNAKTYIAQKYKKNKPGDPDFDSDWKSYLDDNDIHPDDVEGLTKEETINYVYNKLNGILQPTYETTIDTFLKDPNDEIKSSGINILKNISGGNINEALLDSIKKNIELPFEEAINQVKTRSQTKKDEEKQEVKNVSGGNINEVLLDSIKNYKPLPFEEAIKSNPIKLRKTHTKTKEDKLKDIAFENLKNNPLLQRAKERRSKIEDDNSDDEVDNLFV
jgi:hypothetical protein